MSEIINVEPDTVFIYDAKNDHKPLHLGGRSLLFTVRAKGKRTRDEAIRHTHVATPDGYAAIIGKGLESRISPKWK
jgi:hypothetical protein